MKKLLFGLVAVVMFSFSSYAQNNLKCVSAERTFKLVNVIALLETKVQFEKSKNSDEFVKEMSVGVNDAKYIELITPLLKSVYSMHVSKFSQDNAYDKVDLTLYNKTFDNVTEYLKSNPKTLAEINKNKVNWFNLLRKIIDIIDDFIGEKQP